MKSFYDLTRAERREQSKAFRKTEYGKQIVLELVLNAIIYIVGIVLFFACMPFDNFTENELFYLSFIIIFAGILGMFFTELELKSNLIKWYEMKKK